MTTRALRVERVVGGRFGRFSGRQLDVDAGLCVVHGPNESGKSTLSELIAWLVAGIDDAEVQRTLRYGAVGDVLDGRLLADFDGLDLTIERRFNVRSDRRGSVVAHEGVHLGEAATTTDELRRLLGITSADDFERRYRITDSAGYHSVRDLLAHHALGTDPERSPSRLVDDLAARAGEIVPGAHDRRRGSDAQAARAALDSARSARIDALGAATRLDALRRDRAKLDDEVTELRHQREQLAIDLADLHLVQRLLDTRQQLAGARAMRSSAAALDRDQQTLVDRRGDIVAEVASLRSALVAAAEAEDHARRLMARHELTADHLRGVSVPDGTEQRVVEVRVELEAARRQQAEASRKVRELELGRSEFADRFAEVVADVGVTETDARRLAAVSDAGLFDGPLAAWERADLMSTDAEAELPRLRAALGAAEDEVARRRVDFDATGGGDPIRVAAGANESNGRGRRSSLVPFVLAAAIVASGSAALVEPIASVVGAIATAIVGAIWWLRTSRSGSASAASVDVDVRRAAAERLLAADEQVRAAQRDLAAMLADVERHRASTEHHRAALAEFYTGLGLTVVDTLQHARVLRSRHREIVRLVEHLDAADRDIASATADGDDAAERIVDAEQLLGVIADEIGLPGRGAVLDGERVMALRSVCLARDEVQAAANRVADSRRRLADMTGSERIAGLDPAAIDGELALAADLHTGRAAVDAEIRRLESDLERATGDRPGAERLLADDEVGAEVLVVRIAAVEADIAAADAAEVACRERSAELARDIRTLEDRADLPAIDYRVAQATEDLTDAVRRGAAAHFALRLVAGIKDDFERRSQPALVRRAAELVAAATDGEWAGLVVDDDRRHFVVVRADGARFAEPQLSAGAMGLLRLAIRISVAETHGATYGVALPLICDDPTGDIDEVRSPRVWAMLAEAAHHRQVLVFTHDVRTVELASAVGASTVPMPN